MIEKESKILFINRQWFYGFLFGGAVGILSGVLNTILEKVGFW